MIDRELPLAERRSEKAFRTDGIQLALIRYTKPDNPVALIYLHGIESHAGWFDRAASLLVERGFDVFCLDRRGSGVNRENRGFVSGHIDSYKTLLSDVKTFAESLKGRYRKVLLVGLSWGGKLALGCGLDHPQLYDGLILITPGIRALVDVSFCSKLKILLCSVLRIPARLSIPIEPEMFTTTPRFLQLIREDPLRLHHATARFFWESRKLDRFLDKRVAGNRLPILLFLAGQERIIDNDGVREMLRSGGQGVLDVVVYEDQTHSIQFDAPERLVEDMETWIRGEIFRPSMEESPGV